MKTRKGKYVLVTTEYKGVFYGKVIDDSEYPKLMTLGEARNVIYWSSDCNGFLGLASKGYTKDCKIGEKVNEIDLVDLTSMTPVSKKAQKVWNN